MQNTSENAFALAEPLVSLITEEPQWSMQWLDWERTGDPKRIAQRFQEKAFLEKRAEAGMTRLTDFKEQSLDFFDLEGMGRTARGPDT